MKINFIAYSCNLTGGNRVIMEIAEGLEKRGHQVTVLTFGVPEDLSWIDLTCNVIYLKRTLVQKIIGYLARLSFGYQMFPEEETRHILKYLPDADINVATLSYTGFAVHRSSTGIPFHYFMHYEPYVREQGYKQKIITESYYLPTRKIANSTWLAETMKKETGKKVEGLVFPAINHSVFKSEREKEPLAKGEKITIVSLAKYKWWKGFPDALKAIDLVRKAGYDIEFLAFGGSFDVSELPTEVKDIPFTFVGSKANEDLADFYRNADILISASFFESFPLPPLEAMACGTPVVTTKYGVEDYAIDGKNASVIEPKNPQLMAEKIMSLIENQEIYKRYSKAGIETAKKFTWDSAGKEMERIFLEALDTEKISHE